MPILLLLLNKILSRLDYHTLRLKAIAQARIKTDSIDSKILADLLRSDFIPESYIAPKHGN